MRGSIVKRASGRYAVVLDVGVDPATGKRKQKWYSGYATKGAAETALIDLLSRQNRGENIDPNLTPLADYATAWLEARDDLAPLSVRGYRSAIKTHIRGTTLGRMPIGKIRRTDVRAHEREIAAKGLAASTRGIVSIVVSRSLEDAVEDGLIGANPSDGRRRTGTRGKTVFTVWTSAELKLLITAAVDDRLAPLWRLAVASGARRGELLGLTWLGFSGEQGTIAISQQVVPTNGGATIAPCKTKGSHRTIKLDPETVATLEAHKERQLVEREAAGDAYIDRDLIFADELGGVIYPPRLTKLFNRLRDAAAIRPGRLHDVRHSHATHLLTEGVPVHIVAARLGHSSPIVTLSTYAHVLPKGDERAAEVVTGMLA